MNFPDAMKAYIFWSVHEDLFHRVALHLRDRGVSAFTGFAWGINQERAVVGRGVDYESMLVFTRDILPKANDGEAPDLEWLVRRERELGVSIQRMLNAERHLLEGRSFEEIMRLAEVALREIATSLDRLRPDFIFSEDVSCFHSYAHLVLARERGIPFWCIGTGRLPHRVSVYREGPEHWERFERAFAEISTNGMTAGQRQAAEQYVTEFRDRPARPTGMGTRAKRPKVEWNDVSRIRGAAVRYFGDREDPTAIGPLEAVQRRLTRLARVAAADARRVFEQPVANERYVLYPVHYQPEASTLVQAPMYLDQIALLRAIAASLPIGVRLYVKEHVSNRGRRPLSFYDAIRAIPAVRLLSPDEDTWRLIRGAAAVAVITGTVGWEGLLFGKPVITFGNIFFNLHPSVYRGRERPLDRWYEMFQDATGPTHAHDHEATLAMVAALQRASYPGFVANPSSFPEALEPSNVRELADALAHEIGLPEAR